MIYSKFISTSTIMSHCDKATNRFKPHHQPRRWTTNHAQPQSATVNAKPPPAAAEGGEARDATRLQPQLCFLFLLFYYTNVYVWLKESTPCLINMLLLLPPPI